MDWLVCQLEEYQLCSFDAKPLNVCSETGFFGEICETPQRQQCCNSLGTYLVGTTIII